MYWPIFFFLLKNIVEAVNQKREKIYKISFENEKKFKFSSSSTLVQNWALKAICNIIATVKRNHFYLPT
jgi:hypothetical protein